MLEEQAIESPWIVEMILQFCTAKDVLNVLSTSKSFHRMGTTSSTFWIQLLMSLKPQQMKTSTFLASTPTKAEAVSLVSSNVASLPQSGENPSYKKDMDSNDPRRQSSLTPVEIIQKAKYEYILYSSCQLLSSVRWYHTTTNNYYTAGFHNVKHNMKKRSHRKKQQPPPPCAREGHLMCRFFHNEDNYNYNNNDSRTKQHNNSECSILVITGGFTDDSKIYIKEVYKHNKCTTSEPTQTQKQDPADRKARRLTTKNTYTSPFDDNDHDFETMDDPLYEGNDIGQGYGWISVVPTIGIDDYEEMSRDNSESDTTVFHNSDEFHSIPDSNRHREEPVTAQEGHRLHWVYGATLTSLDSRRAIRFGGFQAGGYSMESSQVAILEVFRSKRRSQSTTKSHPLACGAKYEYWATWTVQNCTVSENLISTGVASIGASPATRACKATKDTRNRMWEAIAGRAYHSATLLFDRYLFVVGGMKGFAGSILAPILLDTYTWTWYYDGIVAATDATGFSPSARFGHSVVTDYSRFDSTRKENFPCVMDSIGNKWDKKGMKKNKNQKPTRIQSGRLVLFGGANGQDLLRSGCDNAEVWELNLHLDRSSTDFCNGNFYEHFNKDFPSFQRTFPWSWNDITIDHDRKIAATSDDDNEDDEDDNSTNTPTGAYRTWTPLSPSERLILGRCHAGYKVSDDSVVLLFGSGRPCTNGVLGYNLQTNDYIRPTVVGPLPAPRFTFASTYIPEDGCIVIHGGYSSKQSNCLQDVVVLDVAAAGRPFRFEGNSITTDTDDDIDFIDCAVLSSFPINMTNPRKHPAITDEEAFVRQQLQNPHGRSNNNNNNNNENLVYSADIANFLAGYLRGYYYDDDSEDNDDDDVTGVDEDNDNDDDDDDMEEEEEEEEEDECDDDDNEDQNDDDHVEDEEEASRLYKPS